MLSKEGVRPALMRHPRLASFHPRLEGRQHALGPDRRFGPSPAGSHLSGLRSPCGHWRRLFFLRSVLHASTSLPPFAPRPLRRFPAPMAALTPARALTVLRPCGHERRPFPARAGLPASRARPFVPFRRQPPDGVTCPLSHATPQRQALPRSKARGAGLRLLPADSPPHLAESRSSLSYGPDRHLPLLRTPPRGDALSFGFQAGERMPDEDSHLAGHARSQAHWKRLPAACPQDSTGTTARLASIRTGRPRFAPKPELVRNSFTDSARSRRSPSYGTPRTP
jgi:hypothetical protein